MVTATERPVYQPLGGCLALDFVNTVDRTLGKPWIEHLGDYDDLCSWSEQAGILSPARARALLRAGRARRPRSAAVLRRARGLREAAYRVFAALAEGGTPTEADIEVLNAELAHALAHARLQRRGGRFDWTWDAPGELEAPLWPLARSVAETLVSDELHHLKKCASETCLWLFLDRTRNRQRRWCEMRICGNRAKVRAHRRRARRRPRLRTRRDAGR